MVEEEKIIATEYDKRNYIPVKDADGYVIEKDWKRHYPKSYRLEELGLNFRVIINSLSNKSKEVVKSLKDKYTLQ